MNKIFRNLLGISLIFVILLSIFAYEKPEQDLDFVKIESDENVSFYRESEEQTIVTPFVLSRFFPDEYIAPEIVPETPKVIEVVQDSGPVITNEWKYISTIRQADVTSYYFKNRGSGRVLILNEKSEFESWKLVSVASDFFILQSEEISYKVMK